jgi:4-amino-4-deoxy-L-arabinose transferase-like glycosyltransferase
MSRRELLLWLSAYMALMIAVVWGLVVVRNRTIVTLSTPEAIAQWQEWREAVATQSVEGPVYRRVPKGTEPPALTLMRDYFLVMLGGSVFFATVFFILFGWATREACRIKAADRIDRQ